MDSDGNRKVEGERETRENGKVPPARAEGVDERIPISFLSVGPTKRW